MYFAVKTVAYHHHRCAVVNMQSSTPPPPPTNDINTKIVLSFRLESRKNCVVAFSPENLISTAQGGKFLLEANYLN